MPDAYDGLVHSGFVGGLKRDVLLEAARDLEYLGSIRQRFLEAGGAASRDATTCTVRLVEDLTALGFCAVAMWSDDRQGRHVPLRPTRAELTALVEKSAQADSPFDCFLVSTDAGHAWVKSYLALESKL